MYHVSCVTWTHDLGVTFHTTHSHAMCPSPIVPCGIPWLCHVAPPHVSLDTRCLEKREIPTISKFNEIQLGNQILGDEFNGEARFIIRDLEKFHIFHLYYYDKLPFCHFWEKLNFTRVLHSPLLKKNSSPIFTHIYIQSHAYVAII